MEVEISIIIPVYNTEMFVERCVTSVLSQNCKNMEAILVNDGSTDMSGNICDRIAEADNRVKVIHQSNQGVSAARNAGLDAAAGKYIAFVDSDDVLPRDAMEVLLDVNYNSSYDLVIGDMSLCGDAIFHTYLTAGVSEYSSYTLALDILLKPQVQGVMSSACGKLFCTDIINNNSLRFDINLLNGEDGNFVADYICYIKKPIYNVKQCVYIIYRYYESERVSAVSAFYYDFFRFYLMHTEKLWKMVKHDVPEDVKVFYYSRMMDGLIIYLIWAAAFHEYFGNGELKMALKEIVENEMVKTAILSYRRADPSYSVLIPLGIKLNSTVLLSCGLKLRAKKYRKQHECPRYIKSVYRVAKDHV